MLQMACNMEGSSTTSMHLYLQSPISCQLRVPLNLDELIPKMDQFFCFQFFQGAGPGNIKCIGFSIDSRRNWCFAGPWEVFLSRTRALGFTIHWSPWSSCSWLRRLCHLCHKALAPLASQCTGHLAMLKMHWQLCFFLSCRFTIERGGQQSMWILGIIS